LTRPNPLVCLFLLLGGGAYAATKLPANSVGTKQIRNGAVTQRKIIPVAVAMLRGGRGGAGPPGSTGLPGSVGAEGPTGPRGPTAGKSTGTNDGWTPEVTNSQQIATSIAGRLLVFGHVDGGRIECTSGTGVQAGLLSTACSSRALPGT
jgi:hypothetical protein